MLIALTTIILHYGMLDGSAGVALSDREFLVASDEVNDINVCQVDGTGQPVLMLNLDKDFPGFPSGKSDDNAFLEADIEGAARVGDVIYWIGSHSRDGDGEEAPQRQVFFATRLTTSNGKSTLKAEGQVYVHLLKDLAKLTKYHLKEATMRPPKDGPTKDNPPLPGGLNIESLCASQDNKTLFIGFRNPTTADGRALIVPLTNAAAITAKDSTTPAEFGEPIELNLGGLGLRDMARWKDAYLIVGGHYDEHMKDEKAPKPKLFHWSGDPKIDPNPLKMDLGKLNPEGLVQFGANTHGSQEKILVLSDDGELPGESGKSQKKEWKKGKSLSELYFRSVWLEGAP